VRCRSAGASAAPWRTAACAWGAVPGHLAEQDEPGGHSERYLSPASDSAGTLAGLCKQGSAEAVMAAK
jgi:hypothetical protein